VPVVAKQGFSYLKLKKKKKRTDQRKQRREDIWSVKGKKKERGEHHIGRGIGRGSSRADREFKLTVAWVQIGGKKSTRMTGDKKKRLSKSERGNRLPADEVGGLAAGGLG